MIDVALPGTGGMMPLPGRWLSCLAVRSGGRGILFDCGEGTQVALKAIGWGFRGIDALAISHLHADHVSGLVGILLMLGNSGRAEPLRIYGPPGLSAVVAGQRMIARYLPYKAEVVELWPELTRHLGRRRPFWEFLLEGWRKQGLLGGAR